MKHALIIYGWAAGITSAAIIVLGTMAETRKRKAQREIDEVDSMTIEVPTEMSA